MAEAGGDGPTRVLGSMWGRLVRCEGRGAQSRARLPALFPSSPATPTPAGPRASSTPSPGSPRGLAPAAGRGVGAWVGASSLLPRGSSWVGNYYVEKADTWQAQANGRAVGRTHSNAGDRQTEGWRVRDGNRHQLHVERGSHSREAGSRGGAAPHLGEAGSAAPRGGAGVWGHTLGGLIVLGELQGGSRLMTKRPQAAMLRFICEALRKS